MPRIDRAILSTLGVGLLVGLVLATLGPVGTAQTGDSSLEKPDLLHARIVQLEEQVRQLSVEATICHGQLAQAAQPQIAEATKRARAEAERQAGCPIDWTATPPVCRPVAK